MASVNEELVRDIRQLTRSCGYAVSNISIYELKDIKAPNSPEPIDSQIVDFQFNPWSRKERATFRTVAVRSIKEVGIEEVFDLQIEGTECFIADGLVVHNTRWHERDLAGRILEREGDEWEVLELPMEAYENDLLGRTPGDRLWPEWFTDKMVETAKKDVRSWTSEYQQRPVSDEGDYFKLNWFSEYEQIPDNAHYYGASDYAVTEGHGDFTEHGIFALDSFGNIYMVDWWRGQTSSDIWVERQCDLIQEYQPLIWFGESGVIRRSIEPYLVLRMTERSAMCRIEWLPSMHDKGVRLRSFSALASHGKVFFPKNAAWKAELLTQLTHFPGGRYDDGVDVCSLLGRGLDLVRAPRMKKWTRSDATSSVSNMSAHSWMVS
jgi:predicted phage terminase large subunit-like protein